MKNKIKILSTSIILSVLAFFSSVGVKAGEIPALSGDLVPAGPGSEIQKIAPVWFFAIAPMVLTVGSLALIVLLIVRAKKKKSS